MYSPFDGLSYLEKNITVQDLSFSTKFGGYLIKMIVNSMINKNFAVVKPRTNDFPHHLTISLSALNGTIRQYFHYFLF
jgi:hypothetical protein